MFKFFRKKISMSNDQFKSYVKRELTSFGFYQKGTQFYKELDQDLLVIYLQRSMYSRSYYINWGYYISEIHEDESKSLPREVDCDVRGRIVPSGTRRGVFDLEDITESDIISAINGFKKKYIDILSEPDGLKKLYKQYPELGNMVFGEARKYLGLESENGKAIVGPRIESKVDLLDLIHRMSQKDEIKSGFDSSKSVSFQAHKEARSIDDNSLIPELISIIGVNKGKDKERKELRSKAYFILGHLLSKKYDRDGVTFFIGQLSFEDDLYVLSSMLDLMAEIDKPRQIDISPILNCTHSDKWQIRQAAINALAKTDSIEAHDMILWILDAADSKEVQHDIVYAIAVLGSIGNRDDVSILNRFADSKIGDIRDSAKFAIDKILQKYEKD